MLKIFIDEEILIQKSTLRNLLPVCFDQTYNRLGWAKVASESFNDEQLRALPISWEVYAENADAVAQSSEVFSQHATDIHSIPADIRQVV